MTSDTHDASAVDMRPTSVELFAGCGGLALGLSMAGFQHLILVERNGDAAATVAHNARRGVRHVSGWDYRQADVRDMDWTCYAGADVVAGGPPCQPFGVGGKALGHEDSRDMWPEAVRAVHEVNPRAFAFENVSGLLRPRFSGYVDWLCAGLSAPGLRRGDAEVHTEHLRRLLAEPPRYRVSVQSVNAADFGAAQQRKRVIVGGLRLPAGVDKVSYPANGGGLPSMQPTHCRERLLWDQWISGEYWQRHGLSANGRSPAPADMSVLRRLGSLGAPPSLLPWVTVRDALAGLGEPDGMGNHVHQPGARSYPGHTGSPLDMPSKALKAGGHGVPGGENMLRYEDGRVRYLTVREAARLMGLPDDYEFPRSWSESMRGMGNAVPVPLAQAVGHWLSAMLSDRLVGRLENEMLDFPY